MHPRLPGYAIALGLAGLLPFLAGSYVALSRPDARAMLAVIAYGAVILAFLGGVHWGLALVGTVPRVEPARVTSRAEQARYALGVLPSLIGWAALLAAFGAMPALALAILIAGFVATVAVEAVARRRGLMPPGYMWLRWLLSLVVIATLTTDLTLELTGARIVF